MRFFHPVVLTVALVAGLPPSTRTVTAPACEPNNAGLTLPAGFCAVIFADSVGRARHIVVAPNGDVFVATSNGRGAQGVKGGIVALRDTDGDGKADTRVKSGTNGGNGIALRGNFIYFAPDDAVLRYPYKAGELSITGNPDTLVRELPATQSHTAKTIVLGRGNELFVNIGSPSNSCQQQDRTPNSPGQDPCPQLDTRAGIWQFDATKLNQRQSDGSRYATGLRNTVALTLGPDGALYGATHGRDGLAEQWGMDPDYASENPAEIVEQISKGDDYGWPYCYYATTYSPEIKQQVLNPEYGGDGKKVGRCAQVKMPLYGFPGHWAPNGIAFYTGSQFPAAWRSGALIAFHGSWNRKPPQQGFKVMYLPLSGGKVTGTPQVFADGFASDQAKMTGRAEHRPTGLAVAPDGSLYITDDAGGRIYRVFYTGR